MIPPPQKEENLKMENLSREELKKIEKSMKRPEFMGLLNEYMMEISDPKNKNEYDEYLKQMEREGELPKHMKLAKLKPEFCFRTHIVSTKNKKHEMKFFINMCSTDYIEKPSCEPGPEGSGQSGFNWKVPNSMGKIRYDQDVHGNPCQVVDCAFHPDTFHFAVHPSFRGMIIGIALESAERQLGDRKETLSRDYVILKKVKCKSENGEPALLPLRYIDGKTYNRGQGPAELERDLQGKETKLQKQINKQKEEFQKTKENEVTDKKSGEEEGQDAGELAEDNQKKLVEDLDTGIHAPKYTSIYTYKTDYSEFIDGPIQRKTRKLPNTFTIEFKVPRMENISEATQLQINENKIIFGVEGKYYIDLSFQDVRATKYPLRTAEAKAKFDKKKKILRIAIPVDVESLPEQPEEVEQQNQQSTIIQNQTWKNKVLEISEPTVDTKFVEQVEAKPERKLIEEIDEDDVEPAPKIANEEGGKKEAQPEQRGVIQEEDEDQIREKQADDGTDNNAFFLGEPFTLKKYQTQNPQAIPPAKTITPITNYKYRQLPNRTQPTCVITVPVNSYIKDDVICAAENGLMVVFWKSKNKGLHLIVKKEMRESVKDIQVIERVGFCVFVITCVHGDQDYAQEDLLVDLLAIEDGKWSLMENFTQNVDAIVQAMRKAEDERKARILAEEQAQKIRKEKQLQAKSLENKQKQAIEPQATKVEQKMEELDQEDKREQSQKKQLALQQKERKIHENQPKKIDLQAASKAFERLPIQFIKFNAPFIQALN